MRGGGEVEGGWRGGGFIIKCPQHNIYGDLQMLARIIQSR